MTAPAQVDPTRLKNDRNFWGRLVESAVGAHLVNGTRRAPIEVFYWREKNQEVDFVLEHGRDVVAIEVKSGARKVSLPGMEALARKHPISRKLLVGGQGMPLESFLSTPPEQLF